MKKYIITFCSLLILLFASNSGALASTNTYTVKSGDTLYRIATTYKISVDQLKQWNNLSSDKLNLNQKLVIEKTASVQTKKPENLNVERVITVRASAYTASCKGCSGKTAIGINLKANPNQKVISVDPNVIKLGTKVYVEGYGYAIAADKGSAIKGNEIDVFMPSQKSAMQWGRKTVKVKILK